MKEYRYFSSLQNIISFNKHNHTNDVSSYDSSFLYNQIYIPSSSNYPRDKTRKSPSLKNKIIYKNEFFEEQNKTNDLNDNKYLLKMNNNYSTCNNYYKHKNYNKFLNSHQKTNSSSINKSNINLNYENTTFEYFGGYNKLNTKDLIEITNKRKKIIEQKKLNELQQEQNQQLIKNNLNNIININNENNNIEVNKNKQVKKNFCEEGVQTSLASFNYENNNNYNIDIKNKKDESSSTIILTDKSALINQEISFLSIQCSLKNSDNNNSKENNYVNTENFQPKESICTKIINKNYKNDKSSIISTSNSTNRKKENKIKNINFENRKNIQNNDKELIFSIESNTLKTLNNNNKNNIEGTDTDNNYLTNPNAFQIESNNNTNKLFKDHHNKIFNDSLEQFYNNSNNSILNSDNNESLSNKDENELTQVEEYNQNIIFLQNESKMITSDLDNIIQNNNNNENNNSLLIEDNFNSIGGKLSEKSSKVFEKEYYNKNKQNFFNHSKTNNSINNKDTFLDSKVLKTSDLKTKNFNYKHSISSNKIEKQKNSKINKNESNNILNRNYPVTKNNNVKKKIESNKINSYNKNYLITPRCIKKKRQLNNYVEYFKLRKSLGETNNNLNNINLHLNSNNNGNISNCYKSYGYKNKNFFINSNKCNNI